LGDENASDTGEDWRTAKVIRHASNDPTSDRTFRYRTRELAMNTIHTTVISDIWPGAVIANAGVIVLTLAVVAALVAQIDAPGGGIFAGVGDYITKVGEALGSG
jgi:hypothetical protein